MLELGSLWLTRALHAVVRGRGMMDGTHLSTGDKSSPEQRQNEGERCNAEGEPQ